MENLRVGVVNRYDEKKRSRYPLGLALERIGALLARLELRDAPLFVHPGPVASSGRAGAAASLPPWWPALTDYVAQMQAAWFSFMHAGRRAHPRLRVLFAMLAGGAPLQLERYVARSGTAAVAPDHPGIARAQHLEAMIDAVGAGQLVFGSDRPVVDTRAPRLDAPLGRAMLSTNPQRLLNPRLEGGFE